MKCKYGTCPSHAQKSWSLVPLCAAHYDLIKEEALAYYNREIRNGIIMTKSDRIYYAEIEKYTPWYKDKYRLITKEVIKKAEANGVTFNTLQNRIHNLGWSVERAINTPVQKRKTYGKKHLETAAANGISLDTFYSRIRNGWTIEKASTTPVDKKKRSKAQCQTL